MNATDAAAPLPMRQVAVLPTPQDNAAIASRELAAGQQLRGADGTVITVASQVMEGHRLITAEIAAGAPVLSWGTPFATAVRPLHPGDYVCTEQSLSILKARGVAGLPDEPSVANVALQPFRLDPTTLTCADQVTTDEPRRTFQGYLRPSGRVGTRNHIVVIGITSNEASFAEALAERFTDRRGPEFHGVAPVAHTEAGGTEPPNNLEFVLSVLAGCLAHPNAGAVLLVDDPASVVRAADVIAHHDRLWPAHEVPYAVFSRQGAFTADLDAAAAVIEPWIEQVSRARRSTQPLSGLNLALQCGGSDAFSGITANPLAGQVAAEVIRHGGTAILAETDELIGAEDYVLANVRAPEVAYSFLDKVEQFKQRVGWHGHTAEGNPSGGNIYRGLYNIVLKSLGAARKLPPEVRLDHVIDYGHPVPGPGYAFMDSPGNDLESIAGQVASGCNLIYFTTGNGSITNFPFVPTIKFVTSSPRYNLLPEDMDVNAGAYLDGRSMTDLTDDVFELSVAAASGFQTAGERAAHSQVSIWRDWRQTHDRSGISVTTAGQPIGGVKRVPEAERDEPLPGEPVRAGVRLVCPRPWPSVELYPGGASERLALVLPTSLCSAQIARMAADRAHREGWAPWSDRVIALPHSEGCGVSSGANIDTFARVMVGSLLHPNVRGALVLEHGCEKTHNDFFATEIAKAGGDPAHFGWASVQLDGGIAATTERIRAWFTTHPPRVEPRRTAPPDELRVALEARGPVPRGAATGFATLGAWLVEAGATVVVAEGSPLLANAEFCRIAFGGTSPEPTLAHGQRAAEAGWQIARTPTTDWNETVAGLVATGVQAVLTHVTGRTVSGHRLAPVLQVSIDPETVARFGDELDAGVADSEDPAWDGLRLVADTVSGRHIPRTVRDRNLAFQVTRGLLGTSM